MIVIRIESNDPDEIARQLRILTHAIETGATLDYIQLTDAEDNPIGRLATA